MDTLTTPQMPETRSDADLKAFLLVLRQALLMIIAWIEKRYGLKSR